MTDTQDQSRSATFKRKAKQMRKDRDWTQERLGRQVGLGQSRVAAIEATGSVTIDQAQAFADAFGVPLEVLLYERPPDASGTRVRQEQRLIQLYKVVDEAREEVSRITREISAELPGKLPRGIIVGADWVEFGDGERRHGQYQEA